MATVNEKLQDAAVSHAVDFHRYSNGVVRRLIAVLNRSDKALAAQLLQALSQVDPSTYTVERMESLLASVRTINQQAFQLVYNATLPEIRSLADYETGYQVKLFEHVLPKPVVVKFPIAAVSEEQVYSAALSRPFQGRLLKDWYSNLSDSRMTLIRNAVRNGYIEGKDSSAIARSLTGTVKAKGADGLLDRSRRDVETIVRAALSHTAEVARTEFTKKNDDIIAAEQWTSTLDSKTSPQCRIRDGLKYTPTDHKPIGHSIPWLQGPGKLHFNCRSTSVPITKSWRELGIDADEMTPGQRASMDGVVPADQTYAQWLAKQSAARQDDILGPTRGALYRRNGNDLDKFYNDKGKFLTLDEMKKRDAALFAS